MAKNKMLQEFKEFALKGNAVDMAVGVVIGAAFGKIVTSLVNDIIMPCLGVLIGGVNFSDLVITLKKATETVPAVTLNYGNFIQVTIDFLIIAFSIFVVIKVFNKMGNMRKKDEKQEDVVAESNDDMKDKE